MGRIWDYVYWRLPVGKRQFFDKANNLLEKADSLKQILESGVKNSYNHRNELYNQMSGKIDGLANEVRRLHEENARLERIITHYHKQDMQMFWQEYRKDGESTVDAQKRFFLALPKTQGVNRNLQLLEKDLLKAFVRICDEHQLFYWLYAGTLLGAVRHKGFIPWDDDIDVIMLRGEYEKFLDAAEKELDSKKYFVQREFGEHWPMQFSKLRLDGTACMEKYHPRDPEMHQGVYIDIFPCDALADNRTVRRLQFAASKVVIAKALYARGYETDSIKKKIFMQLCRILPRKPLWSFCVRRNDTGSQAVHSFFYTPF